MADPNLSFIPGTLLTSLLERSAHAKRCGAIQSIPTVTEVIEQEGIAFQVRVIEALSRKEVAKTQSSNVNPFLPYDADLFVASLSPTHVALLNKFNVVDHHLLLVTRTFEDQQSQLTQKDCEALLITLTEIDGLCFYNAGSIAGASQPHKHLQFISFDSIESALPIEPILRFVHMDGPLGTVPRLPFRHAYAPMDSDWTNPEKDSGASLHACYRQLLRAVGLSVDATAGSHATVGPYNLLVTRKWVLLVPRLKDSFQGISINALNFAGLFLIKDAEHLTILRRHGPMTALRGVTLPGQALSRLD